ncbi:ROK family protein [Streptomyces sp. NPDC127074]|uniref:ROK family transcriptional regulator n=1 Tax=Streptomyces sp. NPDC127074 TaxID=3347130 RepID=UPI00364AC574
MSITGGDSSLLRRLNQAAVLRALHEAEELTLTELVKAAAVTRATVENALTGLAEQRLVEEVAPEAVGGRRQIGRPAKRYRFRAESGCVLGLDIGVHKVLAVAADLRGGVLGVRRASVQPSLPAQERLAAARALGHRTLRGAGLRTADVRAVGAGTTGIVSADGTVTLSSRLADWAGTDLTTTLTEAFDAPAVAGNDAAYATLGEHWRGVAAGHQDVLCVHVGHRVSAGVLLGGRLHVGRNGAAGEIGVLPGSGWHTAPGRLPGRWADPEALFAAAREGDAHALRALDDFAADLVQGVAAMVLTVDPELVVIGGGLSRIGDLLLTPLRARLAELCLFPVEVAASALGDEAVALGGARLALDRVEKELFGVAH